MKNATSYEGLTMLALLGDKSETALAVKRITCKMVASHAMFCPRCESVLDQKDVVVFEKKNRVVSCMCGACFSKTIPQQWEKIGIEVFNWKGKCNG